MKTMLTIGLLLIATAGPWPVAPVSANMGVNELIVEVLPERNAYTVAARHALQVLGYINDGGHQMYLMKNLSNLSVNQVMNNLKNDSDVVNVEQNLNTTVSEIDGPGGRSVPNLDGDCDTGQADQQAINRIRAPQAWSMSRGNGVIVAVIDTGIDFAAGFNTVPGYDFVDRDIDPSDVPGGLASGHGTRVASLILQVAPDAQIMPIRAFNQSGYSAAFQLAEAIDYARRNGASVINMSFSFAQEIKLVNNVINAAYGQNIALVAASGNDGSGNAQFPATESEVLSVTAVDRNDRKASFSNTGNNKACGPGVLVEAEGFAGSCLAVSGTSFAAALASGEAALLKGAGHNDVMNDIKNYGFKVDHLPGNSGLGRRLDCVAALTRTNPN
jgi:subtilisin family serine protease